MLYPYHISTLLPLNDLSICFRLATLNTPTNFSHPPSVPVTLCCQTHTHIHYVSHHLLSSLHHQRPTKVRGFFFIFSHQITTQLVLPDMDTLSVSVHPRGTAAFKQSARLHSPDALTILITSLLPRSQELQSYKQHSSDLAGPAVWESW